MTSTHKLNPQNPRSLSDEGVLGGVSLKDVIAKAPTGLAFLSGSDFRFSYANELYARAMGRSSAGELLGRPARECLPELSKSKIFELLERVCQTGRAHRASDFKLRLQTGSPAREEERYFDFIFHPTFDRSENFEGIVVIAVDLTDRVMRRSEAEAREGELRSKAQSSLEASQRLAAIVESSDDAIISKDLNGIVKSWNPGAQRVFGYAADEMIGKSLRKIIPPDFLVEEDRIMAAVARGERTEHFQTARIRKDGEQIAVSLTLSPIFDEGGNINGVASISRDVSQQKRVENALHTSERLATVGRLAATIAHEINNPLEAVTNLVYLAQSCMHDAEGKVFLEQAQQELARISMLTKQTLGFYRETRGARPLTLGELVSPLVAVFSARARNKHISIKTDIRQEPSIVGFPGELRQLFANLLNNSIDAVRDEGRILIRVSAAHEYSGEKRAGVRLTVCDNGPGIASDVRKKLFEPFFTTKREVGTGLGLWVTSNILRKHEGSIRVRSSVTPGRSWTVFSVFLPSRLKSAAETT